MSTVAKAAGLEDQKIAFLQIIHTNIRQLSDYLINELRLPVNFDEEILGREVAKVISYMSFNIDPLQVDVSADAVVNQFLQSTNNLKNISKYKNFRFYPLLAENLDAVAACFGIYWITRVETIKGFDFKLPAWLTGAASSAAGAATTAAELSAAASPYGALAAAALPLLGNVVDFVNSAFGPGDNGRDIPGGIYYFYKYFKGQPYFGQAEPTKEKCSVGYFKGTWKPLCEGESGLSFDIQTQYFIKYYPYIKAGYFKTQTEWNAQIRKDLADIAAGKTPKAPAGTGSVNVTPRKGLLARIFGR